MGATAARRVTPPLLGFCHVGEASLRLRAEHADHSLRGRHPTHGLASDPGGAVALGVRARVSAEVAATRRRPRNGGASARRGLLQQAGDRFARRRPGDPRGSATSAAWSGGATGGRPAASGLRVLRHGEAELRHVDRNRAAGRPPSHRRRSTRANGAAKSRTRAPLSSFDQRRDRNDTRQGSRKRIPPVYLM